MNLKYATKNFIYFLMQRAVMIAKPLRNNICDFFEQV
jgi:hypothetical protein